MKFCLLTIILTQSLWILVKTEEVKDETPLCFSKYDGVCVEKDQTCPFPMGSTELKPKKGEKLCRLEHRRCCVPKIKNEKPEKRNPSCGISSKSKFKVYGGWRSIPGEWPWQAEIERDGGHHCGGAFIHPNWIVTAAHCTFFYSDTPLSAWRIRAAKTNLTRTEKFEQNFEVKRLIDHPGFSMFGKENDIALIELKKPAFFDYKYVAPICLPNIGEKFDNIVCTLTGFGKTEKKKGPSDVLLEINMPIVSLDTCQQRHCRSNVIFEENVCAGFKAGVRDACQGDSGGPLVCQKVSLSGIRQFVLSGVVSYGTGCATKNAPGIYTRITEYLDWIEFETGLPVGSGKYATATEYTTPTVKAVKTDKCKI